jgi:hypothetical protein
VVFCSSNLDWRLPYDGAPAPVEVERISTAVPPTHSRTIGLHEAAAGEQTIRPDAALLFVVGAGWTRKQKDGQPHVEDAEQLILDFLHASRASLGSTKSLTDIAGQGQAVLHCLSHLNQVGQTGSTPRHPKGLSTCCHGEEPHVVGWRFISRSARHQSRSELRLGARKSRRALRCGCFRGDAASQQAIRTTATVIQASEAYIRSSVDTKQCGPD